MSQSRIFFIHIPKTAGRYIWTLVSQNFGQNATMLLSHLNEGGFVSRRETFSLDAVGGHLPYTARELFPIDKKLFIYTIFREPVERTCSQYINLKKMRPDLSIDLDSFINNSKIAAIVDDVQTRMIGSSIPMRTFGDSVDVTLRNTLLESVASEDKSSLFRTAISRLDSDVDFGIKELLERSGRKLSKASGLRIKVNERSWEHCKYRGCLSAGELKKIKSITELDAELYDYALRRFRRTDE